jgi:hypothetical protein
MTARRRAATALTAAAVLGGPAAATAAADPLVVGRLKLRDGTALTLNAGERLTGRDARARAVFTVEADAPEGSTSPYATQPGPVSRVRLGLARRQFVVVGSALTCITPGATSVYGTVVRRARRVVARLEGGRRIRLARRRAPAAWDYGGWVVGGLVAVRRPVLDVSAYDAAGARIARARFDSPQGCD